MVKNQSKAHPAISVNTEIISWNDSMRVASIDAKSMSNDASKYVENNVFQYYTATNTWLILIQETLGTRAQFSVKTSILRDGLVKAIANANALANDLIGYYQEGKTITVPMGWFMPTIQDMNLDEVLQVLRYLKRFTPDAADMLYTNSILAFKAINRWDKQTNWMNYPEWICSRIKVHLSNMLSYFEEEYDNCIPKFSAGTTTHGSTVAAKLSEYSEFQKYWIDPLYPIGDPFTTKYDIHRCAVKITAVPKSYKTYRLIAPEHPYNAAEKQRIKDAIRRSIRRTVYGNWYNPEKQIINQQAAFEGSIDGSYATIDLSSASDTVAEGFAYYVYPREFTRVCEKYRAGYMIIDGEYYIKRMFATSGDPVCFDCEAMLFLAIACSVRDIVHELTGEEYKDAYVYGDDIVIDTRLFDTMIDVLRILRFIPNQDKSFGTGGYRESCGVEYYYGFDVSTKYWPRKVVKDPRHDIESLQSVLSLEQRLFVYWPIAAYLTDVAMAVYPRVTASEPGTECDDLWADSPWCGLRAAPFDRTRGTTALPEWTKREAHTTFGTENDSSAGRRSVDIEMYHYVQFLHDGPVYATDLDRCLGISQPTSRAVDFGKPKLTVSNKPR